MVNHNCIQLLWMKYLPLNHSMGFVHIPINILYDFPSETQYRFEHVSTWNGSKPWICFLVQIEKNLLRIDLAIYLKMGLPVKLGPSRTAS